jgi:hypothetical protein
LRPSDRRPPGEAIVGAASVELLIESLQAALLVALFAFFVFKGRQHELEDKPGWPWMLAGIGLYAIQSPIALGPEWVGGAAALPLGSQPVELTREVLLPLAAVGSLVCGLSHWLPLPRKYEEAGTSLRRRTSGSRSCSFTRPR